MAEMDFSMYKTRPRTDPLEQVGKIVGISRGLAEQKLIGTQTTETETNIQKLQQAIGFTALQNMGSLYGTWTVGHPGQEMSDEQAVTLFQQMNNMGQIPDPNQLKTLIRMGKTFPGGYGGLARTLYEMAIPPGQLTEGPVVNGQPTKKPTAAFIEDSQGGGAGGPTPAAPTPAAPAALGSVPATDAPVIAPAPPVAPVAGASGARLGQTEAAAQQYQGGEKYYQEVQTAAIGAGKQIGLFKNILQDAEKYRTSKASNDLQAFLTSFNGIFGTHISENEIAAGDALRKAVNQISLTYASQFGQTPQQLEAAFAGSLSDTMSNKGIQKAESFANGLAASLMAQAKYMRVQKNAIEAGNGQADSFKIAGEFNDHFDLRVYQYSHLSPGDRADMLTQLGMTQEKIDKRQYTPQFLEFYAKLKWAKDNHLNP
jgi:hypothetical protein